MHRHQDRLYNLARLCARSRVRTAVMPRLGNCMARYSSLYLQFPLREGRCHAFSMDIYVNIFYRMARKLYYCVNLYEDTAIQMKSTEVLTQHITVCEIDALIIFQGSSLLFITLHAHLHPDRGIYSDSGFHPDSGLSQQWY